MLQRFQRKPTFPLELERVLDMLYEAPEVSRDTLAHSRGMLSFPPQLKKSAVFPTSFGDEGRFPSFNSRGILTFPSDSGGGLSHHLHFKRNAKVPAGGGKDTNVPFNSR